MFRRTFFKQRAHEVCPYGVVMHPAVGEGLRALPPTIASVSNGRAHEMRPYGVDAMCLLSPFYPSFPYSAIRRTLT